MLQKIVHSQIKIPCDLPQQRWRNIPPFVKRDSGTATLTIPKLLAGSTLSNFHKAKMEQNSNHFGGLQDRNITHGNLSNRNVLNADKIRLTIFQQHGDHLTQIFVQLIKCCSL